MQGRAELAAREPSLRHLTHCIARLQIGITFRSSVQYSYRYITGPERMWNEPRRSHDVTIARCIVLRNSRFSEIAKRLCRALLKLGQSAAAI